MSDNSPVTVRPDNFGHDEGSVCFRDGCKGVIASMPVENCSCHIRPPCNQCTEPKEYCPECNWMAKDEDGVLNGYVVKYADKNQATLASWKPRPLDPRKIDYRINPHTHASQLCVGVYPEGTTRDDVEAIVKGTFGGRFNHFGNGKFEYVAYTD